MRQNWNRTKTRPKIEKLKDFIDDASRIPSISFQIFPNFQLPCLFGGWNDVHFTEERESLTNISYVWSLRCCVCTAGPNVSNVGVITLWLCQNGYWPLIVDFPIKNGGSFHSYVSLPEGTDSLPKESAVFVPHWLLFWGCLWANSHPNALANAHDSWATKTLFSNISCNLISYQIICKPAPIHRAWLW